MCKAILFYNPHATEMPLNIKPLSGIFKESEFNNQEINILTFCNQTQAV